MSFKKIWLIPALALALFLVWRLGSTDDKAVSIAAPAPEAPAERKVLYWYDPMVPGTHFEQPGRSPFMDMELMPRYADEGGEGASLLIDPAQLQNLALSTTQVTRGRLVFTREIPAQVMFNSYQTAKVQPRAEGFVEEIHSFAVGDPIAAGETIADITVPAWASDQSEYLLLKNQRADSRIIQGVREKMRLSGIPDEMLDAVDRTGQVQTRLKLVSPLAGVITELNVYPGMNVDKNQTVAVIEGLDPVWVRAEIPERDLHLVNQDSRMTLSLPAWPGRLFPIESWSLLPKGDPDSRTAPLRLVLANSEGLLTPGLTASLRLRGLGAEGLLIPTQSLIDLGDEQRVITRDREGRFRPKAVEVLSSSREMTAIAGGLAEGEEVVASGLFLIDSEANLRGALNRMRPVGEGGAQ
jgi:Cu(I)/Ag(I) efflux system membrane fusion protein